MSVGVDRIPKGLHHLESVARSKFTLKRPTRVPGPPKSWVPPASRIKRWNIVPGDNVRLVVGKPEDKFIDESKGVDGGWRVYKVARVDLERNKVYLTGLSANKSNPIMAVPEDIETGDYTDEQKEQFKQQKNFIKMMRPVHYSNVQLCVEDKQGPDSVFATRVCTGGQHFDRLQRRMRWDRFASKLSGPSTIPPDAERGLVRIDWPVTPLLERGSVSALDTVGADVGVKSLGIPEPSKLSEISDIIPPSLRSPPPAEQFYSNEYIHKPSVRSSTILDVVMPLYLSEELSPRFSRAKQTRGWNARREAESRARIWHASEAVDNWEQGGRDEGLESVLELDDVGLEGVRVRGRTRKEVRESAQEEFDQAIAEMKKQVRLARAEGKVWDWNGVSGEVAGWLEGEKGKRLERKRERKERKARKIEEKLANLSIKPERNTVVPPDMRS